jgi:hypothetical protein
LIAFYVLVMYNSGVSKIKETLQKNTERQAEKQGFSPEVLVLMGVFKNIKTIQAGGQIQINGVPLLSGGGLMAGRDGIVNIDVPEVKGKTSKLIENKEAKKVNVVIKPMDFGQVLTQSLGIITQINTLSQKQKKLDLDQKAKIEEMKSKGQRNPRVERRLVKVDPKSLEKNLGLEQGKHFVTQELSGETNAVCCGAVTVIPIEVEAPTGDSQTSFNNDSETNLLSQPRVRGQQKSDESEKRVVNVGGKERPTYNEGEQIGTFGSVWRVIRDEEGRIKGYITKRNSRINYLYYSGLANDKSGLMNMSLLDPLQVEISVEKLRERDVSEWVIGKIIEFNDAYRRLVVSATLGLQYRSIQQIVRANLDGDIDKEIRKQVEPVLRKVMEKSRRALKDFSNSAKRFSEMITLVCQSEAKAGRVVLTPAELVFLIQAANNFFVGLANDGSFLQVKNNQL